MWLIGPIWPIGPIPHCIASNQVCVVQFLLNLEQQLDYDAYD